MKQYYTSQNYNSINLMQGDRAVCGYCGKAHTSERREYYYKDYWNEIVVCRRCIETLYEGCDNCGYHVLRAVKQNRMCPYCNVSRHYRGHDYKPDYRYICSSEERKRGGAYSPNSMYFIGVEIELEKGERYQLMDMYMRHARLGNAIYAKHDGSLDETGIELVSMPMTFRAHREFNWEQFMGMVQGCGYKETGATGLHIHFSRNRLTDLEKIKLGYFLNTKRDFWRKIFRRRENRYTQYHPNKSKLDFGTNWSRYEVVNFMNDSTVEIRGFKSTNRVEILRAYIEFADILTSFVKIHSCAQFAKAEIVQCFVNHVYQEAKNYPNLVRFLKVKRIRPAKLEEDIKTLSVKKFEMVKSNVPYWNGNLFTMNELKRIGAQP